MPSDGSEHELIPELTTASIVNRKSWKARRRPRRERRGDKRVPITSHVDQKITEERVSSTHFVLYFNLVVGRQYVGILNESGKSGGGEGHHARTRVEEKIRHSAFGWPARPRTRS